MSAPRHRPSAPAPDRNGEARIQAAIVEWVRAIAPDVLIFAVPNGGLRSKAEAARLIEPEAPIIAADTIVSYESTLLGKPRDAAEARRMLQMLRGQTHDVVTAVALMPPGRRSILGRRCPNSSSWMKPIDSGRLDSSNCAMCMTVGRSGSSSSRKASTGTDGKRVLRSRRRILRRRRTEPAKFPL